MKNYLQVALFALAVSLFYTAVGQRFPQIENHPPKEVKLGVELSPDELVEAGAGVFDATCVQCHRFGRVERCPDLGGIGARAAERAKERAAKMGKDYSDSDYIFESLCDPGAYVVEPFGNIMPAQGKQLTPGQLVAVAAFLQDHGGSVSVGTADAKKAEAQLGRFKCMTGGGGGAAVVAAAEPVGPPEQIFTTFGCNGCHSITAPTKIVGPSLMDVGKRLDDGKLYESILDPDKSVAEGFPKGLMKPTLESNGFYERMTPADYRALVDWLSKQKG
jgi:mono/diheme cytochrome c family protein